ncbi:gip [Mytilus edulis]|uniref:Hyi n=1 Tax=Mytilus edulis TaxID=6550 RepID=A0A8S3ULH8_MYTED|nr:gip [Mytilus edulis]
MRFSICRNKRTATKCQKKLGLEHVLFNGYPGDVRKGDRGIAALPDRKKEFQDNVDINIQYAKALDCKRIHVMAGVTKGLDQKLCDETYLENIALIADKFAKEGLTCMIEPINDSVTITGYYLTDVHKAVEIIKKLNRPNVKLQFDFFHMQLLHGNFTENFKKYYQYIDHIQVAQAPDRSEPGFPGEVDYSYVFKLLEDHGYEGYVGLEYMPRGDTMEGLKWLKEMNMTFSTGTPCSVPEIKHRSTRVVSLHSGVNQNVVTSWQSVIVRCFIDFICLFIVAIPILIIKIHATPFSRGFYCDDESLMHPHKPDTVPTWVVCFIGMCVPIITIIITEGIHLSVFKRDCSSALKNKPYIKTLYRGISAFLFGCAVTQLTTDIAKYSLGRLRPHYLSLCKPAILSNCSTKTGYIETHDCTSTDTDALQEARLSFPSGHTSFAFFCMLYLVVYLQIKFKWRKCWLVRPFLQGAILGIIVCFFTIYLISDLPKVCEKTAAFATSSGLPLYKSTRNDDHSESSSNSSTVPNNGGISITSPNN